MNRRYLTTPIYYATGDPHLGHAYTTVLTDTLARYYRQTGAEVRFLTGTDEHGQKMQETAAKKGLAPIELADQMAKSFEAAWKDLNISFDRFIRTTEPEHIGVVRAFLERLWSKGQIYDDVYSGWYCVQEERYWTEREVGADRICPDCKRPVEFVEEKNYFFRMSDYQERLIQHIEDHPDWIVPVTRRNEILGFLKKPLQDLSISRPKSRLSWGVTLPFDPDHVCYVWVDALINYVTASGLLDPDGGPDQPGFTDPGNSWWPASLHVMGKDILTTHAVYWPTLLMAAGLPLPKQILAHGWWVMGDQKMAKSVGNVVDPLALREDYGTDGVRWYLLRDMPTGSDASYTPQRFQARYDELANVLGNLASRAISMIVKYRDGIIPEAAGAGLDVEIESTLSAVTEHMDALRVHDAMAAAMDLARTANGYVDRREPWAQAKDPSRAEDLDETLASLARVLTVLTALFLPATPEKMTALASQLGLKSVPTFEEARSISLGGLRVEKGTPLFPRPDQ
ncbi:MAG: methionine--tRNA ligase [Gemmatimonadetes bacterium]|nr:methionine--tRNA ligase [Gemmatimonadota bacterium]